jgi:hypothetical protein
MYGASGGSHLDLMEYFIEKNANAWNLRIFGARIWNHPHLIQFFSIQTTQLITKSISTKKSKFYKYFFFGQRYSME